MPERMEVGLADPQDPGPAALLAQSRAYMVRLYALEENHQLDPERLQASDVRFVAAVEDGRTLGIGAISPHDGYAEVKSIFTASKARGRVVADAVLSHLIRLAAAEGRGLLRLETGSALHAAHRLYERHGFTRCGPFGSYRPSDESVFFERRTQPTG